MDRTWCTVLILLCLAPASGVLHADVVVVSSLSLVQFTIAPQGLVTFTSPQNAPATCVTSNLCATAFAQAQDSQGGFDQQYDVADNGTANASATTALASATSTASAPNSQASASSGVNLSFINASASSSAFGSPASLVGTFVVTEPTAIQVTATLASTQTLMTDAFGLQAFSEVSFLVTLNGTPLLGFDNPLTIYSNGQQSDVRNQTLNGTTPILQPNTSYSLFIQTDSESSGINSVPESSFDLYNVALVWFGLLVACQPYYRNKRESRSR